MVMSPSSCSILMAPQHSRMMAIVCKLLSPCCSLSILITSVFPLEASILDSYFFTWSGFSTKEWLWAFSKSVFLSNAYKPSILDPQLDQHSPASLCLCLFIPHTALLPGVSPSLYSDLCSILLPPQPCCAPLVQSFWEPSFDSRVCPELSLTMKNSHCVAWLCVCVVSVCMCVPICTDVSSWAD